MLRVYLAGPIDLANGERIIWKTTLKKACDDRHLAFTLFDPAVPYHLCGDVKHNIQRAAWIETINNAAIDSSDVIVAHVPAGQMSVGTPIEIDRARKLGKHIMVFSDVPYGTSAYLTTRVAENMYFMYNNLDHVKTAIINSVADQLSAINDSRSK